MGVNQQTNLRYMAIKADSAAGTYTAPTTSEFCTRWQNITVAIDVPFDDEGSKYADGTHAEQIALAGIQTATISAECKMSVGASQILLPNWYTYGAMYCGLTTTGAYATDKGNGIVRRAAKDDTTCSICIYDREIGGSSPVTTEMRFTGCIGTFKITCDGVGKPWIMKCTWKGVISDIIDGTALTLSTPGVVVPQLFTETTFTIATYAYLVDKWEFDVGNECSLVKAAANATGASHFVITKTNPRLSINALAVKQATTGMDVYANLLSKPASNTVQIETAAASRFSLKIMDVQNISLGSSSRDGLNAWDMNFRALSNGVPGTLIDGAGTPALTYEDTFELLQGTRT